MLKVCGACWCGCAVGGLGGSVLTWLIQAAPDVAHAALCTATAALWWPHNDGVSKAIAFCKCAASGCVTSAHRGC